MTNPRRLAILVEASNSNNSEDGWGLLTRPWQIRHGLGTATPTPDRGFCVVAEGSNAVILDSLNPASLAWHEVVIDDIQREYLVLRKVLRPNQALELICLFGRASEFHAMESAGQRLYQQGAELFYVYHAPEQRTMANSITRRFRWHELMKSDSTIFRLLFAVSGHLSHSAFLLAGVAECVSVLDGSNWTSEIPLPSVTGRPSDNGSTR